MVPSAQLDALSLTCKYGSDLPQHFPPRFAQAQASLFPFSWHAAVPPAAQPSAFLPGGSLAAAHAH